MKKYAIPNLLALSILLIFSGAYLSQSKGIGFSIQFTQISSIGVLSSFLVAAIAVAIALLHEILKLKLQLYSIARNLKEQIHNSVENKFIEISPSVKEITELAVEIWRIEQRISKSASGLTENQMKGLENSLQKLKRYLEKYDVEIVDYNNKKFNEGLNLEILSIEKDPSLAEPIVKETVEPTIMCKGQVVRKAKIILLTNK